jgi:hypothetical protein
MPVIDASVAGIVLNAVGNTVSSRARLDLDRTLGGATTSYYSTTWPTASSPLASTLVGMEGDGIVDVTSHFGWSEFVGGEWQTWFQDEVEGATVGSWEDSGSYDSSLVTGRRYELGIDGGTIYIGYSPSTGRHFEGTIGGAEVDPGCQGL